MTRFSRPPKKITWKSFWLVYLVIIIAGILGVKEAFFSRASIPTSTVPSVSYADVTAPSTNPTPSSSPISGGVSPSNGVSTAPVTDGLGEVAASLNLAVPFTSQAPTGNWDVLHEDACEEASFYMVMQFYAGNKSEVLDSTATDVVLKDMVAKETADGLGGSITLAEAKAFLQEYAKVSSAIIDNPSVDDIKALIAKGEPVIVPAAGRELGNPNFTGAGPLYHMLVIRGYDADGNFITNDPGTRHGENYTYSTNVLMNAMGDWNNGDPVNGSKRVLVVSP